MMHTRQTTVSAATLKARAFTIVELLVVITIIVVLLSLLAPALDTAIYQAELAVCGSKLHALANGTITYAMTQRKFYPYRPSFAANGSCRPIELYWGMNGPGVRQHDDRKVIARFVPVNKTLNCPLVKETDIEDSDEGTNVFSTYGLYFGWGYHVQNQTPEKSMRKLGDRWEWQGDKSSALASDWDSVYRNGHTYSTHPDKDGVMPPFHRQDEPYVVWIVTLSYWGEVYNRPPIDTNHAMDDGSVLRFNDVTWDDSDPQDPASDKRLLWMPQTNSNNQVTWFFRVPGTR